MKTKLTEYVQIINQRLSELVPECEFGEDIVHRAMRYSLNAGGKRLRPVILLECCRICSGNINDAVDLACAVEMIHTYSLIHDDLPCMDDDDLRRGMPSCHVKFGEKYALLAGDALLTEAFRVVAESEFAKKQPDTAVKIISALSTFSGCGGMIGGQVLDLVNEDKAASLETLQIMDKLKTGALIRCSAYIGALCATNDEEKISACLNYAENIGLAFQIVDDILDVTGDEKIFGKPIGSDTKSGKSTYVTLLGIEKSKEYADKLTQKAISAVEIFNKEGEFLKQLALYLNNRTY